MAFLRTPADDALGFDDDDDALRHEFEEGNDEVFAVWMIRYQPLVSGLLRRFCRNAEETKDLSQKVFLQALEGTREALKRLPEGQPFSMRAWLGRIAVNVGKNHLRESSTWKWVSDKALSDAPSLEPSAPKLLEAQQQKQAIARAVLQLPERQRDVFVLRIDGGLSFSDIAHSLGIEENNAKVSFHLAVKRLKTFFETGEFHDV